jgi:DNA-binding MarR family transcriptional regulator
MNKTPEKKTSKDKTLDRAVAEGKLAINCHCTALRKATRNVSQYYDSVLAPCGLRSTQRSILNHIARAGTPVMGDLAASLVLDRSALLHNLKPLQRDGYVEVTVDEEDKRARRVSLTALGQAKLEASTKLWNLAQKRFEQVYGAENAEVLRTALRVLANTEFDS